MPHKLRADRLAYHRRKYRENRDARIASARQWKIDAGADDFDALIIAQSGLCAICGEASSKPLGIDHCHDKGHVRGLLCNNCNVGLGMFSDDPIRLQSAIDYLKGDK